MAIMVIIALLIVSSTISVNGTEGEKENKVYCGLSKDAEFLMETVIDPSTASKSLISATESNSSYEYVIITSKDFESSSFRLLVDYKSQYISATIVILEDIIENSSFWVNGTYGDATNISNGNIWVEDGKEVSANFSKFNDTAAMIRNFIRCAYHEWGTKYVLLGGDVEIIPVRKLYVNLSDWYSGLVEAKIEGWIPSDLYFGCLDGTWNDDFDKKFGEQKEYSIAEEADFISEVYIGRAPVDSKYDVATFVNKVIQFETTEKPKDVLLHQSNLRPRDVPDTSVIPDACAHWIPDDYDIRRLYQKNEKITINDWISCFGTPSKLVVLHVGNGYYNGPGDSWYQLYHTNIVGTVKFKTSDIYKLRNTFYPIHISISCLSGNFCDTDCIAEELLLWSQGGPSACFFNSDVGVVNRTDASKYSAEFIEKIFYEIFENNTKELGKINLFSKYHFINLAQTSPTYRWCYYEINLLGDPETPVTETRDKLPSFAVFVDDDFNESTPYWNKTCFSKIQDAVNAVPENGVVNVYSGMYLEAIAINKTINLIGEDKYTTIIDGTDSEIVVTARSNSSLIKNFTICHNISTQSTQNQTGIYIPSNCWGNDISNNIITYNSKCGILIQCSCRTYIHDNIIQFNGEGVCIVNEMEGIYSNYIVITCHNMIHHNKIVSNENYGVYLEGTLHNEIINNTFMNNGGCYEPLSSNSDAFFKVSRYTIWAGNYWGKPCDEKYIYGTRGPIFLWLPDITNGIINWVVFPSKIYLKIINIGIQSLDIDKNPAQEPYDIK